MPKSDTKTLIDTIRDLTNQPELTYDSSVGDIKMDSLSIMDMVLALEDVYDVNIPDSALAEFKTIGDMVKYIQANMID